MKVGEKIEGIVKAVLETHPVEKDPERWGQAKRLMMLCEKLAAEGKGRFFLAGRMAASLLNMPARTAMRRLKDLSMRRG